MEKYLVSIFLSLTSTLALAQAPDAVEPGELLSPTPVVRSYIMIECINQETTMELVRKYQETFVYKGNIVHPEHETLNPMMLFANKTTGSWTLIEKVNDDLYCLIAAGNEFQNSSKSSSSSKTSF